jgi:hypothetical protein
MEFVHLSPEPIEEFRNPRNLGKSFKPKGSIWFSCGNEWEEWMAVERFVPTKPYKYKYKATLDLNRLLILKTNADIKAFSEKYSIPDETYPFFSIDWNQVRKETGKSGLYLVNAKLKTARKKYAWYLSFDICSAVIWNKNAILSFTEEKL